MKIIMQMQSQTILCVISFPLIRLSSHSFVSSPSRAVPSSSRPCHRWIFIALYYWYFAPFPDIVPDPRRLLAYSILFVCLRPWESRKCEHWNLRLFLATQMMKRTSVKRWAKEPRFKMYAESWKGMFRCVWCPLPASLATPCQSISLSNSTRQGTQSTTIIARWFLCSSQFAVHRKQSTEIVKKHKRQTMVVAVSVYNNKCGVSFHDWSFFPIFFNLSKL